VAGTPGGLTVAELAVGLDVGRTVAYRLVATLEQHGLVRRDVEGRVRIGPGVLALAAGVQPVLLAAATPVLRRLAEDVGATAHLTVGDGDEALAVAVVEPSWTAFHVAYRVGSRHPLGRGAAGRAVVRAGTATPGWVVSTGELQEGASGIAAPVLGVAGLQAGVGVVALGTLDADRVGPRVELAAAELAAALR